ncbi:MAG TPA: DUF262 domain-containing protein [Thermoanaerobaculia bacterium]|nr:DUF262 domain-containing protein [Thermoanaerobaculia bacterium]
MTDPHLEHPTIKVRQLVEDYNAGRIVIPEFQREYVWQKRKAPLLIDSLYRGFPISSLLLWQSAEESRARRRDPRPARLSLMNWLIDGQQRVITLARTMSGDEGIDVVFHPDHDAFKLANAATRAEPGWVRVAELWDDELYRQFRRNLDGSRASDKREARFEAVRRILEYEIPLVRMVDHSFKDAVGAFKRINTLGVKLKQQDIESAEIASRHSGFIADEVAPFLEKLRQQGFDRLNIMHLFRACAFVAKPDGRNRTPLHELERQEVLSAWSDTKKATDQAIGLIRSELGLVNMNILWSGALVVPVIALCATTAPRQRDSKAVAAWLALAALLHRYSGSAETALDQDLRACRATDPIRSLLSNLRTVRSSLSAEPADFGGALADRSGLLALYVACMHRGILDFFTGAKVLLQANVDRHHILPRAQFPDSTRSRADNVANIAFIAEDVNKSIGLTGPEVYLKQVKPKVLESQCVPLDPNLWSVQRSSDFWQARRSILAEAFNEFVREALPHRRGVSG